MEREQWRGNPLATNGRGDIKHNDAAANYYHYTSPPTPLNVRSTLITLNRIRLTEIRKLIIIMRIPYKQSLLSGLAAQGL